MGRHRRTQAPGFHFVIDTRRSGRRSNDRLIPSPRTQLFLTFRWYAILVGKLGFLSRWRGRGGEFCREMGGKGRGKRFLWVFLYFL
jgi:hypothetical protein